MASSFYAHLEWKRLKLATTGKCFSITLRMSVLSWLMGSSSWALTATLIPSLSKAPAKDAP